MSGKDKTRIDALLVARGLAESRERARALVLAGRVFSGETRIDKAGTSIANDAPIEVRGDLHPYVSRGGVKMAGALDAFRVDPKGRVAADFGASTGGFTDCLLQRGASRVYAIDVGFGQLHARLRGDARVVVRERTNARHITANDFPEPISLIVIDASFIGLEKLLPAAKASLAEGGEIVALLKPQFEVGREHIGKHGVVRDQEARAEAIARVQEGAREMGLETIGCEDCVLPGPRGNVEVFLHLRPVGSGHAESP